MNHADETRLSAGAARVDITPDLGVHLAGGVGMFRPARNILDKLWARALVLESGSRRVCILTLDVTIITGEYTEMIRACASERFGLHPDATMVHATQTHSAPTIGHLMVDPEFPELPDEFEWVRGGETAYSEWAAGQAVEAIGQACANLQPVSVSVGSGIEGRFAFNRRAVRRDGTVAMPGRKWEEPLGPTWISHIEGPIDPEVGVVSLRGESGEPLAIIANYTCHPVHIYPRPEVSADWPGALADALCAGQSDAFVALVTNGACGNINPWPPFDPDYVEDHTRMGEALASVAGKVLGQLDEFDGSPELDYRVRRLHIPIRELREDELAWAQDILQREPVPHWIDDERTRIEADWMAAASIYSVQLMRERSPEMEYEVQVIRIGDVAFVGLPGEPFVEAALAIKIASPARFTYIAHCTSHYVGYIPTADALRRGGHEVNTRYWAKLVPEAFEMIVAGATALLAEAFGT